MKIIVDHCHPPIPTKIRYLAYDDDQPEDGCGHGATVKEAVTDLLEMLEAKRDEDLT